MTSRGIEYVCDFCGCRYIPNGECPSCALYNAAVEAQKAAAHRIARDFNGYSRGAWLNEYGVFARVHGKAIQVGSPEQSAPFVALTRAARKVKFPHGRATWDEKPVAAGWQQDRERETT